MADCIRYVSNFHEIADKKGCNTNSGIACELPFSYNGAYYDTCINVDNGGVGWCYTNVTSKMWENCDITTCPDVNGRQ